MAENNSGRLNDTALCRSQAEEAFLLASQALSQRLTRYQEFAALKRFLPQEKYHFDIWTGIWKACITSETKVPDTALAAFTQALDALSHESLRASSLAETEVQPMEFAHLAMTSEFGVRRLVWALSRTSCTTKPGNLLAIHGEWRKHSDNSEAIENTHSRFSNELSRIRAELAAENTSRTQRAGTLARRTQHITAMYCNKRKRYPNVFSTFR